MKIWLTTSEEEKYIFINSKYDVLKVMALILLSKIILSTLYTCILLKRNKR